MWHHMLSVIILHFSLSLSIILQGAVETKKKKLMKKTKPAI